MIEQIKSCNDQLANKLASIEQNIFGTCWSPEILKEKINKGEFLYWIFNKNNNFKSKWRKNILLKLCLREIR